MRIVLTQIALLVFPLLAPAHTVVAYFTDPEGSRLRFENFLRQSPAFELGTDNKFHLKKGAHFVFGGDAADRYLGNRWVVSELVRLKHENREHVALIMGNREFTKMRLASELTEAALQKPAVKFHFVNNAEWEKHQGPESASSRLKFMLAYTMGAPKAFELWRQELMQEHPGESISDEAVVESFKTDLGPGGIFREFLELGQLIHRIKNTVFVHGGITDENLETIPDELAREESLDRLIPRLNAWYLRGVRIWEEQGHTWSGEGSRPEDPWLNYPIPKPGMNSKPDSVVTGRNFDLLNNPVLPSEIVIAKFRRQGVQRTAHGHTPTGDYAVITRSTDELFEDVSADNSFAQGEGFASLVHFEGENLEHTSIRGMVTLETGQAVEVETKTTIGVPTPVGKRASDGGIILGSLVDDPGTLVTFRYGEKFKIFTKTLAAAGLDCQNALAAMP